MAGSAASGGASRSWRRSTRGSSRTSTPATASSRSSRISRFSSALRGRHRRLAGPPAAGRGTARASRAPQAEVRSDAGGRHRAPQRAPARAVRDSQQGDERAAELEREHSLARQRYLNAANALSQGRRRAAAGLAAALEGLLADLAMERTRFEVRLRARAARRIGVDGRRHRPRRVLRFAEPRRGPPAAGPHRVRRGAVAHHAGDQDADRRRAPRLLRSAGP